MAIDTSFGKSHISKYNFTFGLLPDTISEDTTDAFQFGDTILGYVDGGDSIFEVIDTLDAIDTLMLGRLTNAEIAKSEILYHGNSTHYAKTFAANVLGIELGYQSKSINQGLYGINIEGFFKPKSFPNDGTADYAWDLLADLAPEVIRFPSGESGKFMHLLHNTDGTNAVGYGYDIFEIARYFNWTDGNMEAITTDDILNDDDFELNSELSEDGWIAPKYIDNYTDLRDKYFAQECDSRRYIDDFIELIDQINNAYPGRPQVKVILSLNIMSETAEECKAIADYLRAHDVNVIGVELGNETYAHFYRSCMGFNSFVAHNDLMDEYYDPFTGNYWDYINGENYSGDAQTGLFNVLSDEMEAPGAHDFIGVFKESEGYEYKIGLVGKPLGDMYAFRITEELEPEDPMIIWNDDLYDKYDATIAGKYCYDAVILHTYYSPDNWKDIALSINESLTCNEGNIHFYDDRWHFNFEDNRLQNSFEDLTGYGTVPGNFRDFIRKASGTYQLAYKPSFNEFNAQLHFDLENTDPTRKELWITEWNLKDKDETIADPFVTLDDEKLSAVGNTLLHGALFMQWFLKNIKINYDTDYRENFFTYATVQGFGGGVGTDLLMVASPEEKAHFGVNECPYAGLECFEYECITGDDEWSVRHYWVPKTSYYVTALYSEIFKNNLKYLKCNYVLPASNINVVPTTFIDQDRENLYIYFTNLKDSYENFSLDPTLLIGVYSPAPETVSLGLATIHYIESNQLYGTSGNTKLYDPELNFCYASLDHPLTFQSIIDEDNDPQCTSEPDVNGCLTAPPYSIGYFIVPITPNYGRQEEATHIKPSTVTIYPNPLSDGFYVAAQNETDFTIKVISLEGVILLEKKVTGNDFVPIGNLPSGCYIISVTGIENTTAYFNIVKI